LHARFEKSNGDRALASYAINVMVRRLSYRRTRGQELASMKVRRIVTGYNAAREALVKTDEELTAVSRADVLDKLLDDWEGKHGKLTEQEFARAARELAPPVKSPRK
jgi:hypothetical protein